ncbi:MAG: hypothetical protein E7345_02050 [Clostridiales bacterium]|nr:hypothetical protein [Clostridiales bacterium]
MKKKLVIFCLMLCSIFGFVACGDEDPYASVTISKVGGNEPIHLMLEEVRDGVYESTSVSFEVQVSAETDVDLGVSVGAGRGFITTTSEYIGDGKTKITANAISPSNKGPFTLEVSAISGGEKCQIPFIIDVKLNDFDFKQNSLISAIRKGDSIDLSEVKSFIDFKPQETTQQNLKFDVVIPDGSTGDGVQYSVAQEELEFGKFAKFVNGTTLQTYSTYLDAESKEQPVTYPKKTLSSGSFDENAQATYDEVVRISATYSDDDETTSDIVKYFDVVVLNDCTDIKLLSSLEEQNEKDVLASVSDKYEYNVKLVDQGAKGRLSADPNIPLSYYFGRALKLEYKAGNPSDFEVVSIVDGEEVKAVLPKHGKCVSILPSGELNAFSVESLFAGTYTHTFLLRHKEYPQAISHEIIVNFEVVSLPNTLYINNQELSLNPFLICDNYPGNGAEFNVQLGDALEIQAGTYRNWNYYLATDSDQLASKLTLNVKGMQETVNFARLGADSLEKGEDPVVFGYGSVFYLKHEFSDLSEVADNTIYIAIEFSLDTLSDEISTQYIYYPIKLKFEKTLATFFGENYEKTLFIDTADLSSAKTKLFALESELTPQKVVQSIEYDKENLKIDYEWSEEEGYVYYVEPLKTMKKDFKVTFTAKHNKLQESITIKCYMTSFYSLHSDAPLALEMLSTSNSYLYYVTNTTLPVEGEGTTGASALEDGGDDAETFDPKAKCEFGGINYESVAKLFMHPNSSVSLGIYDFLKGERIDISKNVKISIGNNRYVALQDGILTTQGETGETQITISYEFYRLDNKTIKLENRRAVLYVYILQDFKDLEVDVNLVNDTIYLQDYLGYYDIVNPNKNKMHEKHISTNFNKLTHAGVNKDWVGMKIGFSANDEAISLTYSYEMMSARPIYDSNGQQVKIKSQKTTDEYALEYGDLFRVDKNETTGECVVTCVMSEDLKNFINNHITIGQETILREIISSNNIVFQVDIKVRQFNYETVASSVTFRASVPEKTNGVKLDVGKQGIYEEIVGGSDSIRTRRIGYTINNFNATNKKLTIIQDVETTMFTTQIVQTNNGNTGYIEITPKPGASASEYYIVITTEDNIKGLSQSGDGFDFYNGSNMFVQTVRVTYSDGSVSHPFEISTIDDFDRMVNNVNEGHYNYYVLVNDIDLSSKNNFTPINLTNTAGRVFSLSGKFVSGTGKDQTTYYSSILNLRIRKNLTSSNSSAVENIGLFGKIATGVEVKLEYLTIKNAEIVINNSLNSGFTGTVNVGIFAGLTDGGGVSQSSMSGVRVVDNTSYCKINSCVATGTIEVIGGNTAGTINIGGFVGNATKTAILGLPDNRVIGVSSTYDNANVVIKLSNCGSSYVAGGIVGRINSCQLTDLQVVSLITAKKVGVFGGCVGLSSDAPSNISSVTASPKILVETDSNNTLKVGGILGESTASTDITHAIVYFVNIGNDYLGIEKINFRLDAPNSQAIVGGIVGSAYGNINYSYVRSFYNSTIGDNYLGNIYANVDKTSEIGGIVGNYSHGIIKSSYFDGDIAVVKNDGNFAKTGLMLGGYKNVEILDSYAVGLIYRSEDGNTFVEVKDVVNGASIIGSIEFIDKEFVLAIVNNEENEEDDQVSAVNSEETLILKISNSYAVLNNNVGFIVKTESSKIVLAGIYSEGNLLGDEIKNSLTKITDGSVAYDSENHKWFYNTNNKINTVGLNETTYQILPIIIDDKGKLMYDLVATGIDVGIDGSFKYDIHYDDENGRHHQILMLLRENPVYNIVISEELDGDDDKTCTLVVSYRGETIDATNFKLKSNDRIELSILEDGDKGVFKLQGNTIVPLKAGKATLVISSYLDRDIKAEILIKVMHGISSNYHLENSSHEEVTEIANKTMYVTERNTFYIGDDNSTANDVKYLFHLVSCGVTIDNTYTNTGNIIVNGVTVNDGGVILLNNKQLDIIPKCKIGTMVNFKLVPILNLGDVTYNGTYEGISYPNSYIMKDESMIKSFTFDVTGRTIELVNDLDSSVVSVSSSTQAVLSIVTNNITTTVTEGTNPTTTYSLGTTNLNELSFIFTNKKFILPQNIVGADGSDNTVSGNVVTMGTKGEFNYALFTFKFKPYTYEALSDGMFKVSIEYEVVFNETFYIDNAHMYDLSNINCKMTVMSETNTGLYSLVNWSIAPNELSRIYMDYYPRTQESNREYTILTETNTSSSMVYNENGIMKLTLDEKLNNSSYVEVLIPIEFKNDIILKQVSGVVDADTGILSKYYDIQNLGDARDHGGKYFGIRLARQTSSNDNIINYGNTYYIRLCMIGRLPKTSQIPVIVHSYEVKNNIATKTYENQKILSVQELPELSVALKGETDVERNVIGRGVKKQLDINIENITNNIYYSISTNSGKDIDKIFVARYNGNKLEKANGVLDISYINSYFVCVDVECTVSEATIEFYASEVVLGEVEIATEELTFKIVEFEIDYITIDNEASYKNNDYSKAYITINQAEGFNIALTIKYKPIEIGTTEEVEKYKRALEDESIGTMSNKNKFEYQLARTEISNSTSSIISLNSDVSEYWLYCYDAEHQLYEKMDTFNTTYNNVKLITSSEEKDGYTYSYASLVGKIVSENNQFRLQFKYFYDYSEIEVDGKKVYTGMLKLGDTGNVYEKVIDIIITVEDNSTEDHPTPIRTQEELVKYCNSKEGEGNYILLNDINLIDWEPMDINCRMLDGNGYVLKVSSFNMDKFRNQEKANAGIFSTISEHTLLKNITIDISELLVTETKFLNDEAILENSKAETYVHNQSNIDLSYIKNVNFGVLAGENNGTITNVKVVNTYNASANNSESEYFHVLVKQRDDLGTDYNHNIAGLVAVNNGYITNSFAGISSKTDSNGSIIKIAPAPSDSNSNENQASIPSINVYPFAIVSGNVIGGLVSQNTKIISNSFVKGVGIYNLYPLGNKSATGGFVANNSSSGLITSCYAEGQTIESYRAVEDISMIESRGSVGGLVYENAGKILNSYANVYIEHRGAFSGAFVFNNTNTGTIENSYSAGTKKNSSNAYGVFTGIENANINNSGTYTNCYYLILGNEATVSSEKAVGMLKCGNENLFAPANNWYGFKFATGDAGNGEWKMGTYLPKLESCEKETFSHRTLLIDNSDSGTTGTDSTMTEYMYYYQYHSTYSYGLAVNPIILDSALDFNNYILNYSDPINNANPNAGREVITGTHFRMVKDLDFTGLTTATKCKNSYIFQTIFSGVLDGNGMSLKNLSLNVGEEEELNIDKFGLFGSIQGGTIKNLTITLSGYSSGSDVTYGGILAGTITNNSTINNVHIIGSGNGNGKVITAKNMAGALAGKIDNCNISDITVENIAISLGYSSVKNGVNFSSNVSHDYKTYSTNVAGNTEMYTFVHYDGSNDSRVSYAGGIAGVLQDSEVYDVTVKGNFEIQQSDIAGGLFGFVGKIGNVTTKVETSKFIVSGGQSIKSFNIAGGLVGELYNAEIDYSSIEHDKALQDRIDDSMLLSDKDRERGYNDLFKLSSIYNIAVGGIVGYMKNAELSNSYSKVNVINPNSFIAGGLVGYVDNEIVTAVNKISYCYSTGSVYSGRIIGGSIGLQLGTTLNMDRVVALTDWNNAGKDDNEINYRNKITERLYSNQVGYYIGNGNYNNFYIKMPEIGNLAPITPTVADDDEHYNRDFAYTNSNIKYLVGSSIGKVVYEVTESNEVDDEIVTTITYPDFIDVTTTNITNIVDQDHNITGVVFSNTLGRYTSSTNSYLDGNKVDSYEKDPFTISISGIGNRSIGSYRYAYRPVEESTEMSSEVTTNKDSLQYSATKSGYYDIMSFPQIFTAQEYAEQLMGAYSELVASGTSKTNKFTRSVFDEKYDRKSRFAGSQVTDGINTEFVLIDGSSNWVMDEYLPAFKSSVDTTKEISTQDQFINAINTKSDATHILTGDITIEIEDKRDVWIRDSIKFSLIGNQVEVSNAQVLSGEGISARRNPRIEFNIINSSTVHSIFNIIDNVTWKNVDIIINYSNGDCNVTTDNFGLFVNTLNRSLFDNCNITINMGNKAISNNINIGAVNVGLVFGVVQTTQIADVNVRVVNNVEIGEDVTVYDGNISIQDGKNFGIVAGNFASSSLNNVTVDSDMSDIKLVVANGEYNVGMVGSTTGSSLYNVTNNINKLSITSSKSTVNAGGFVGNQDNSDIISVANSVNKMKIVLSGNTSTDDETYVSIGGFVGKAFNVNITQSTVNSECSITVSNITAQSYIGGVVGRVVDSDNTSSLSLTNVSNFADIGVSSTANSSNGIYVGGIIGYVKNFIGNTIYANSEITANVQCKLYVGGVVGYAKKSFTVTNVLVAGMINALSNSMLYCGGILGHRDQFITMQGFSVLATITDGDGVGRHSTSNTNYMAGVTYDSKRMDTLTNGFVYTEIPSGKNTYAISKYTTDTTIENVYFAQEFATNNYESNDSFFNTFALADLYFSTDNPETTEIVELTIEANTSTSLFAYDDDNNYKMDTIACGNVKVFVPKAFTDSLTELNFTDYRFNLEMFSVSGNNITDNKYYVINESANVPSGIASVGEKTIISGRTQINNDVISFSTLTAGSTSGSGVAVTSYIIGTNNGVISNLRIDLSGDLAFCNTNSSNGLIVGVSVYGNSGMLIDINGNATSDGNITSAFTVGNAGNIYKCISSYVAVNANCKTIYAFSSNNTGKIIDVYSATIGYSGETKYKLYLVKNANSGYCKNYVIYVPQEVSKFNRLNDEGNISQLVKISKDNEVWEKYDNGEYGFVLPLQEHVFRVKLLVNGTLLESISELNSQMSDPDNIDSDYVFTYSLEINSESEIPTYDGATVKLIYNDTQLIELFKGLEKDYYYRSELKNSIILLIGDSFELKLPSDFTFMVISENSAIIGIPLGDDVKKVTMEITDNNGFDVFIQVNSGLIANINFNFQNQNFNECTPITQNIGVIYNVALSNLTIFVTNNNAKEELNSVQLYMSNSLYVFCGDKNGPYCGTLIRCMVDQYKIQFDYNGKVHTLLFSNSANNYGQLTEVEGVPGRYQVVCFSRYN